MVVLGEDQDAGSVVVAADADVVQAAVDAQGDGAGLVDAVESNRHDGLRTSEPLTCGYATAARLGCCPSLPVKDSAGWADSKTR